MITEKLNGNYDFYRNESNSLSICLSFVQLFFSPMSRYQIPRHVCLRVRTENPRKKGWKKVTRLFDGFPSLGTVKCQHKEFVIHSRLEDWLKQNNLSAVNAVWVSIVPA